MASPGKHPCPSCPSSDAFHRYPDGSGHCFSCEYHERSEGVATAPPKVRPEILTGLEFKRLASRKISQEICKQYSYGISGDRQVACYYDAHKQVVAQKLRGPNKTFSCLGNINEALLFGQHLFPSGGKRLFITEGEIDALSIAESCGGKWPVVSIPNGAQGAAKAIKKQLTWVESFDEIILCFDSDEPGFKAAVEVCQFLKIGATKIAKYPEGCKDASDVLQRGYDLFKILLFESQPYRPDGIVSGVDLWDELADYYEGGTNNSFPYPWPLLNLKTRGQRKGELITWTAGTGVGKSTIVNEIAYDLLVNQGRRVGVVALEESKRLTGLRYISIHAGKRLHLNPKEVPMSTFKECFEATLGTGRFFLYDHFGSVDSDSLLDKIRYLAVSCECDFIVLDHLSIAVSGLEIEDERKAIDVLVTGLRSLIESTGVGVHAICHLRRPKGDQGFEDGAKITLGHLRGSGGIAQLSDGVYACERNTQDEDSGTQIRVLKQRFTGDTGPADRLMYDKETGRFNLKAEEHMFNNEDY